MILCFRPQQQQEYPSLILVLAVPVKHTYHPPFQTYHTKKRAIGTMSSLSKSRHEDYHWGEVRHDSSVPQC